MKMLDGCAHLALGQLASLAQGISILIRQRRPDQFFGAR
jgi:hypothetical protein